MKVCPIPNYYIESNLKEIRKELLNQINALNFNKLYINLQLHINTMFP